MWSISRDSSVSGFCRYSGWADDTDALISALLGDPGTWLQEKAKANQDPPPGSADAGTAQ